MRIAVIGTGTMGPSIAQAFSECDKVDRIYLCKSRESSRSDGMDKILRAFEKQIAKNRMTRESVEICLSKIETGGCDLAAGADLIIEAVAEDLEIKRTVFRALDAICPKDSIFATNTSSIPVQDIGKGLGHVLIGMHFFNPVPVMRLVEIVTTNDTPRSVAETAIQVVGELGKTPVEVQEAPGFVVNRVLIPMINEAISIYAEGVASVEDIDTALRLGANHPMGPLALGDLIGLDVVLAILNVMLKETGDNRYLPQPMLKKMVREKKLGRKTGEGFYKY